MLTLLTYGYVLLLIQEMSGTNAVEIAVNDPLLYAVPLPHKARLYPLGFPLDIATNSKEVLAAANESWGVYPARFDRPPLRVHVVTTEGGHGLPPDPVFRAQEHLLNIVSDQENFAVCDRLQGFGHCFVTRATVADPVFFRWHFLDAVVYMLLEFSYATSLHAACVALDGAGVLLYGVSGTGKSTLAYACARSGWTYISDDGVNILWDGERTVIGEPHRFRFRADAPDIFPELQGLTAGRELDRKPTIEVRTADLAIRTSPDCRVEKLVFLERRPGDRQRLVRISREDARARVLADFTLLDPALHAKRMQAIESVLEVPAFELRYESFEDAVVLLEEIVRDGDTA